MNMKNLINEMIKEYANKYNDKKFIFYDPIRIPNSYKEKRDVEVSAFITSWLSWGNRKMILRAATMLQDIYSTNPTFSPYDFIKSKRYKVINKKKGKLYRTFGWDDFYSLCERLNDIYARYETLEDAVYATNNKDPRKALIILFRGIKGIPSEKSASKRICMFLRWMIRRDGIVDFGIWRKFSPADLMIPVDTHVLQQAHKLGITNRKNADIKTAHEITAYCRDIFPDDPCLADFALFGMGIECQRS